MAAKDPAKVSRIAAIVNRAKERVRNAMGARPAAPATEPLAPVVAKSAEPSLSVLALEDAKQIFDLYSRREGAAVAAIGSKVSTPLQAYTALINALPNAKFTEAEAVGRLDTAFGKEWRGAFKFALESNPSFGVAKLASALIAAKPFMNQLDSEAGLDGSGADLTGIDRVEAAFKASRTPRK